MGIYGTKWRKLLKKQNLGDSDFGLKVETKHTEKKGSCGKPQDMAGRLLHHQEMVNALFAG